MSGVLQGFLLFLAATVALFGCIQSIGSGKADHGDQGHGHGHGGHH